MAQLSLSLLGEFEVSLAGQPVTGFKSNKVRALLAYLAVEADRSHQRDSLVGLLWADWPESKARGNLRHALANLRQVIADQQAIPPFLLVTPTTIQFNRASDFWLDVADFSALTAALSTNAKIQGTKTIDQLAEATELYRGRFLEGFSLKDSPAFDDWVLLTRERLQRQVLAVLFRLAGYYEQQGEYERASVYAWRQVELEPWQEEAHRQLMTLLALRGQRSAALAQYEICRRLLAEELGVEPALETTALYEQIRTGELSRGAAQPERGETGDISLLVPSPSIPSFLAAVQPAAPPPFVARDRELVRLHDWLNQMLAGQGGVIFITGGAGRGKTALLQAFARRAQASHTDLIVALGRGNAFTGLGDPYLPFREILEMLTGEVQARWAAGAITAEHATRLWHFLPQSLQALLEAGPDLIETFIPAAGLVARARAQPVDKSLTRLEQLVAQRTAQPVAIQQSDLFEQYVRVLQVLAGWQPLLLFLDDLQWADNGSINLLFQLGRQIRDSRILLIGAYRPGDVLMGREGERHPLEPLVGEFKREFGDIEVSLGQTEDRNFIEAFLDTEPNLLGAKFRETLYHQTQGHPLFTVELLRGMQERGDLVRDEAGRWVEGPALNWDILPARVEAVIAERIARLPAGWQALLAAASVEGEEFTAEVLAQVQRRDERELIHWLSGEAGRQHRLVDAASFRRFGAQTLSHYRFRHYLFQKYLYQSLDPVERAHLHEATGLVLETLYADHTAEVSGQLARHFEAAKLTSKAIDYLLLAGQRALQLSANEEAIGQFNRGLELIDSLTAPFEAARQELRLRTALGAPLLASRGFAAPVVKQTFSRAWELCRQLGQTPDHFPVLWGLWSFYLVRADYPIAQELVEQLLQLAQNSQDSSFQIEAYRAAGVTLVHLGEPAPARDYLEQAINLYDPQQHQSYILLYGSDPGAACRAWAAWALVILGYPDQAVQLSREALAIAQEINHPFSLAFTMFLATAVYQYRREAQLAREWAEATITLSTQHGFPFTLAMGLIWRGWALARLGQGEQGIAQIQQGLSVWQATGAGVGQPQFLALLAEAYREVGQAGAGLAAITDALAAAYNSGELYYEAELHRLKGQLLLMLSPENHDEAESAIRQAITVARHQQTRWWELRAMVSLYRLLEPKNRGEETQRLLTSCYEWFTEGFDTADLKAARNFLAPHTDARSTHTG